MESVLSGEACVPSFLSLPVSAETHPPQLGATSPSAGSSGQPAPVASPPAPAAPLSPAAPALPPVRRQVASESQLRSHPVFGSTRNKTPAAKNQHVGKDI